MCTLGCGGRECDEVLLGLSEKQEIQLSETGKSVHLLSNPVNSVALRLVTTAFGKGDKLREQEKSRKDHELLNGIDITFNITDKIANVFFSV